MRSISHILSHKEEPSSFLFLISLPQTAEFEKETAFVSETISQLRELGVVVHNTIDGTTMSQIVKYKYVIVIAHYEGTTDSLILSNKNLTIDEFIRLIPKEFSGVMDFSSCYSAGAMTRIKARTDNKCKVQAVVKQTTLALRMIMYPHIVKLVNDEHLDYEEAYCKVLDTIVFNMSQIERNEINSEIISDCNQLSKATKLGTGDNCYTIYAPMQVKRKQTFIVSIFFHKDENSDFVELSAQRLDPKTLKVEKQIIPIDLHLKDKLVTHFSVNNGNSEGININNGIDTKSIIWLNRSTKIQFPITVGDDYSNSSLLCEIRIEVNSEPVGECYFDISVSETESQVPCSVSLVQHDYDAERNNAREYLHKQLNDNLNRLEAKIKKTDNDAEISALKSQLEVCNKCIKLISEADIRKGKDSIKKVFISSTSDMAQYRDIVKNEILSCGMFPVDYRTWYQSDQRPCDICCKKVMESDAVLCIIGSKYGYVEPSIGISMTQMEYEAALMSGIKVLAYIIDPLDESNEDEQRKNKQNDFINEIKSSRIIKFFTDDYSLEKDTTRELSYLK